MQVSVAFCVYSAQSCRPAAKIVVQKLAVLCIFSMKIELDLASFYEEATTTTHYNANALVISNQNASFKEVDGLTENLY